MTLRVAICDTIIEISIMRRDFIISSSIIGGALLAALLVQWWVSGIITSRIRDVEEIRSALTDKGTLLKTLTRLKNDSVVADELQPLLESLIPKEDTLLDLSARVEAAAREHKVLAAFKFQGNKTNAAEGGVAHVGFSLDAEGVFADIAAFMDTLETPAKGFLLGLDSYNIARSGEKHRISATGRVFFVAEKKQ